jgi:hypothetical protein
MTDAEKLLRPDNLGVRFFLFMRKQAEMDGEEDVPSAEEMLAEMNAETGFVREEMLECIQAADEFLRGIIVEHGGTVREQLDG